MDNLPDGFVMCDTCGNAWYGAIQCNCRLTKAAYKEVAQSRETTPKTNASSTPDVSVSQSLIFTVYGQPIPKARPRTKKTKRGYRTITPQKTRDYEKLIATQSAIHMQGNPPMTGLLSVSLWFYRETNVKADIDNLCKSILDAMNGIVYEDDTQVRKLSAVVVYDVEKPNVVIQIDPFNMNNNRIEAMNDE